MEVKTKMNEKLIKPGVVKRIADSLRHKDKNYTQEDIETILSAFWDVVIDAISNGDSVKLNGYATIGIKHMAERKSRNVVENRTMILPEHYRVHFKPGSKLNQAAKDFTAKELGGQAKNE